MVGEVGDVIDGIGLWLSFYGALLLFVRCDDEIAVLEWS